MKIIVLKNKAKRLRLRRRKHDAFMCRLMKSVMLDEQSSEMLRRIFQYPATTDEAILQVPNSASTNDKEFKWIIQGKTL